MRNTYDELISMGDTKLIPHKDLLKKKWKRGIIKTIGGLKESPNKAVFQIKKVLRDGQMRPGLISSIYETKIRILNHLKQRVFNADNCHAF